MRVARIAVLALAAVAAGPAGAQNAAVFGPCASAAVGKGGCTATGLARTLDGVSPGYGRVFRDAGMESHAILSVLSSLGDGVQNRLDGGDCVLNNEALMVADEVWTQYVRLPQGAPAELRRTFAELEGVVGTARDYIAGGMCQ